MSTPAVRPGLMLSNIVKQLRTTFEAFADPRSGRNTRYTMVDAALSAFSVFFMQSPPFLEHQRTLQEAQGKNNAQTLFGVYQIPTDNHIRTLLDGVEPTAVYRMFTYLFQGLQQEGMVDRLRALGSTRSAPGRRCRDTFAKSKEDLAQAPNLVLGLPQRPSVSDKCHLAITEMIHRAAQART
nr:hypothetical protein [Gammaproteobacteria bacterium]